MKYKKIYNYELSVYYEFIGEDREVGRLYMDNSKKKVFVFKDAFFNSETLLIDNSLSDLQDQISNYYSSKDTIGKIENEFPFYSV